MGILRRDAAGTPSAPLFAGEVSSAEGAAAAGKEPARSAPPLAAKN